jgi:two-component system, cell cycle sensor histidine kinase and response regulator CckA
MSDAIAPPSTSTVLVTDDDLGVRTLVSFVLERAGFRVLQASSGREAVDVVRERGGEVDAVLLDVMMPEMNGPEALPHLRDAHPDLPVVFYSGFDRNEVADHLVAPSAYTSFVPKPCDNAELVSELRRAAATRAR